MQPLRRGRPAYMRGTPVRWTALEIMLIILSLVMIVAPLSIGVTSLIIVPPAPAQELAQGPTRTATTPTGNTPTATMTASSTPTTTATISATTTTTASSTPTTTATISATTITATATTTATVGIQLFKLASLTEVASGQPFRYTIWVATTSSTAQTVILEDPLDTNLELLDVSTTTGSCSTAQIVRCNLETRRDEAAVVSIQVRVRTGVAPATIITNSATANGVSSATISVRVSEWVLPSPSSTSPPTATLPVTLVPTTTTPGTTVLPATPTSPSAPPTEPPIEEEEPPPTTTFTPTLEPQPSPTLLPPTSTTTATPPARRPTMPVVRTTTLPVAEILSSTATLSPTVAATASLATEAELLFFRAASDWGSAYPEQQVSFTFVVENSRPPEPTGANDLLDLQLTGRLPNNLELLGASVNRGSDPQFNGQDVIHYLDRLRPGESLELSITTRIRPQVAAGTLLIAQGQLSYAGLAQALFSNIVAIQVVSARPPAEALLMQIAAAYPEPPTTSPLPPTATAPPPTLVATLVTAAAPTSSTTPMAIPPPVQPTPLPHTQGMVPLVGILLLGTTLFTRTLRLHRARGRL